MAKVHCVIPGEFLCKECGGGFTKKHPKKEFCSPRCQGRHWEKNQKGYYLKRYLEQNPKSMIMRSAKYRAKKRGIPFSLTLKDFEVPDICPILGIPLKHHLGEGAGGKPDSPSLDRIIPNLGYVKGNVWVISHLANSMKSVATKDQLIVFANWVLSNKVVV